MRNQLQNTTVFVVVLVLMLGGSLYLLNSTGNNQLTSATTAGSVDCSQPLPEDAAAEEKEMYNNICDSEE